MIDQSQFTSQVLLFSFESNFARFLAGAKVKEV